MKTISSRFGKYKRLDINGINSGLADEKRSCWGSKAGQLAMSRIPMDIGIAIKSTKLLDFKPILKEECSKLGIEIQDD